MPPGFYDPPATILVPLPIADIGAPPPPPSTTIPTPALLPETGTEYAVGFLLIGAGLILAGTRLRRTAQR